MRILCLILVTVILLSPYCQKVWAQNQQEGSTLPSSLTSEIKKNEPSAPPTADKGTAPAADKGYEDFRLAQEQRKRITVVGLMVAALLALGMMLYVLLCKTQASPTDIVHGSGLVLVVFATVLVVAMAETDQQLTAAIGILGAITGYLFGATARSMLGPGTPPEQAVPTPTPPTPPTPTPPSTP